MTKPLSTADARWLAQGVVTKDMVPAIEAIRDGHHGVIKRVTEAEALDQAINYRDENIKELIQLDGPAAALLGWLTAYRALGAIKEGT